MIGIDFGTTNTCAAIDGGIYEPVRAVSLRPENTQPYDTVIASSVFDPFGTKPAIGRTAQEASRQGSDVGVPFLNYFKPHLDHQRLKERRRIVVGTERVFDGMQQSEMNVERCDWVNVGGEFSRKEIAKGLGVLLNFVIGQAVAEGGADNRILLGTPVSFSSRSRKRLLVGLFETGRFSSYRDLMQRVRFVHEPIAAAAAAMVDAADFDEAENVLVFDHGGGTLDLSIVRFERHEGFDHPVPMRELAAGGTDDVAGRAIDSAFTAELRRDPEIKNVFARLKDWEIQTYVEGAKIGLSTAPSAPLVMPNFAAEVDRETFNLAMRPLLAQIEVELEHVLLGANVRAEDINRVVMTGGSSLNPCVQDTVRTRFADLDEYRLRMYDPAEPGDVEQAITEVAQGLVRHAQTNTLEHVVHWDLELLTSEGPEFTPIAKRGERFDRDAEGRPTLVKTFPIRDLNRDGLAIGLYEHQLDWDFVFGIADIPTQVDAVFLRIHLRPDALFPRLEVLNAHGEVLRRKPQKGQSESTRLVVADLDALSADELESFFDCDVEYLPDSDFSTFEHAPLVRRLRDDDYIEWTRLQDGKLSRNRGEIKRVVRVGEHEGLGSMTSWNLRDFAFIVDGPVFKGMRIRPEHGYVRLAPRPPTV